MVNKQIPKFKNEDEEKACSKSMIQVKTAGGRTMAYWLFCKTLLNSLDFSAKYCRIAI